MRVPAVFKHETENNNKQVFIVSTKRHANATTTPEMREFIHNSDLPVASLARLLNISESTVRKWRKRETLEDGSHAPQKLNTRMTAVQEYVVVELRKSLLLSLDELLQLTREFINVEVSRAGLARCLKRHGVSRLSGIHDDADTAGDDDDEVNAVHLNIEHLPTHKAISPEVSQQALAKVLDLDEQAGAEVVDVTSKELPSLEGDDKRRCLFVAKDPVSRWVYVDIYEDTAADAASRYMSHALRNAPFHIRRILAGNYNEFLQRYRLIDEPNPDYPQRDDAAGDSFHEQ